MPEVFKILVLGDVVGSPARRFICSNLRTIVNTRGIDFVIANCENATSGAGITKEHAEEMHSAGIDIITLGDHAWDKKGFDEVIDSMPYVARPANINPGTPGKEFVSVMKNGKKVGVSVFLGRHFMKINANCPFNKASEIVTEQRDKVDIMVHEIHAEATSEKIAFGWFLDGKVDLIFGTHTHVQTSDERILRRGTAYITDLGMCGAHESVIGRDIDPVVSSFVTGIPHKFTIAENDVRLNGIIVEFNTATNKAIKIQRIMFN